MECEFLALAQNSHSKLFCEPEGTRTPNLLIRSQVHYPIMLQVHIGSANIEIFCENYYADAKKINNSNFP